MITTNKFSYIHLPKTGGTFVTDALFKVYQLDWTIWNRLTILFTGKVCYNTPYGYFLVHGPKHPSIKEIELKYRNLPILTNIRNPLDLYVSEFEFGWWKRKKYLKYYRQIKDFKTKFKNYPDLTFQEFIELQYDAFSFPSNSEFSNENGIGLLSKKFLSTYVEDPERIANEFINGTISSKILDEKFLSNINFLLTHNLNMGLYDFLKQLDFKEDEIKFIIKKEKVLPLGKGRTKEQKWETYYTEDLKQLILKKDRLLFELFPEFVPKTN